MFVHWLGEWKGESPIRTRGKLWIYHLGMRIWVSPAWLWALNCLIAAGQPWDADWSSWMLRENIDCITAPVLLGAEARKAHSTCYSMRQGITVSVLQIPASDVLVWRNQKQLRIVPVSLWIVGIFEVRYHCMNVVLQLVLWACGRGSPWQVAVTRAQAARHQSEVAWHHPLTGWEENWWE